MMKRGVVVVWSHKLLYVLLQNHLEEPSPAKREKEHSGSC